MEGIELSATGIAPEGEGRADPGAPRPVHPAVAMLAAYSWRLLVIAGVGLGVIRLLGELKVVVVPVLIGLLLTRVLEPFAARLRRHRWKPGLAAITVLLSFFAAVALVGSLILPAVVEEFSGLGPTLAEAVDDLETWLVEDGPVDISRADIDSAREAFGERVAELFRSSPGSLAGAAGLLVEIPTGGLLAIFLTFFMIKDGERFLTWVRSKVPTRRREMTVLAARRGWGAVGAFLRGAALLGTLEAIIIGVSVFLVGGELVVPIMVLTFSAAFIPILGAITAGVVAVLVTLVTAGGGPALIIAVVAIVVQQLDNDLLAPVIYGRMLKIHPAVILVGVVGGGALFGILGTLFAVPVLVVVLSIADEVHTYLRTGSARSEDGQEIEQADVSEDGGSDPDVPGTAR